MNEELKWLAVEYREIKRTNDWYWAVGITAVALTIASILIKNFLFAIFIILSTILIFYFAKRKPQEIEITINKKGIAVGELLYPTESIKHFWIDHHSDHYPKLLFMSSRMFDPIISVYINEEIESEIKEILSHKIPEKKIKEPKHRLIMEKLGF